MLSAKLLPWFSDRNKHGIMNTYKWGLTVSATSEAELELSPSPKNACFTRLRCYAFWAIPVNHRTQSAAKFSEIQTFLEGNTGTSAAYIKRGPSCLKGLTKSSLLSLPVKGAPPSYVYSAIAGWPRHPSPFPFPNPLPPHLLQQTR